MQCPRNLTPLEENGHTNNAVLVKIQKKNMDSVKLLRTCRKCMPPTNYKWSYKVITPINGLKNGWLGGHLTSPIQLGATNRLGVLQGCCLRWQDGNYRVSWGRWFQVSTIWIHFGEDGHVTKKICSRPVRQKLKGNGFHHPRKGENKKVTTCSFQSRCSCLF